MTDIIVTTLEDEIAATDPNTGAVTGDVTSETADGEGLSLREALQLAQNGDRVLFADNLSGTIRIDGGFASMGITTNVSIYGDDRITISGDVNNDDVVTEGLTDAAATMASGNFSDNQKIFFLANSATNVLFDGLTLTGGRGTNGFGGAVDAFYSGLTVQGSTFAGNISYGGYGGGAIYTGADLTVEDSTFFDNIAIDGTNTTVGHGGGAIFAKGASLSIINTTFAENQALNGTNGTAASGGAIFVDGGVYLNNVTMTGNQAQFQGGGLFASNGPVSGPDDTAIFNSIILGNNAGAIGPGANNELDGYDPSIFTISNSITSNADGAVTGVFAETQTINVTNSASSFTAGVLADNEGPVQTVALLRDPLNPAIDGGGLNARLGDARGISSFGARDIGAYELIDDDNLVVTSLADGIDATDGVITLREAVLAANARNGVDTISFEAGLEGLIRLTEGELVITDELTIQGGGAVTITGDANGDDILEDAATYGNAAITDARASYSAEDNGATTQLLDDNSRIFATTADLSLDGLTLTGGSSGFEGPFSSGGAVLASGMAALTVTDSQIVGNILAGFGRKGGGLFTETGALTVTDSTIAGNVAWRDGTAGAGLASNGGEIMLSGTTVTGNAIGRSGGAQAGGVYSYGGNVTIAANSVISNNQSGIYGGVSAQGGGVHVSDANLTVTDSLIFGNQTFNSGGEGGGVYVRNGDFTATDTKIYGNGAGLSENDRTSSSSQGGGVYVRGGDVTLTRVEVTDNYTAGDDGPSGGGIYVDADGKTLTITDSLISGNEIRLDGAGGGNGGGVSFDGESVVILGSEFSNNRIFSDTGDGGGLDLRADTIAITDSQITSNSVTGDFRANGGGLAAELTGEGAVTLTDVTVANNAATGDLSVGGGVYVTGGLTIVNSTISGNTAAGGDNDGDTYDADSGNFGGGGVYGTGAVTISGSTISGNMTTGLVGRGAGVKAQGDVTITGSTFANNTAQGARANGVGVYSAAAVTATNSTFVGNRGYDYDTEGGAIYAGTNVALTHVTITGNGALNSANTGGGVEFNGTATVANSIIIGNVGSFGGGELDRNDSSATPVDVTFTGFNLVGATSSDFNTTGFTNVANASAASVFAQTGVFQEGFGALADNGGPVQTVALLGDVSNPALDVVSTAGTDARGFARTDLGTVNNGGVADLGAFEFQTGDDIAPPSFTSIPSFGVGETLLAGLNFTPVTVNDVTAVTFSIDGGPDAGAVSIDAVTGVLSFNGPIDFENPTDANRDNRFEFSIRATDEAGNFSTDATTIDITDVNEAPTFSGGASFNAPENQAAVADLLATDPEDAEGAGLTYSISGGTDAALFNINAATGALSFNSAPNFEAPGDSNGDNAHAVTVRATDSGGLTADRALTIRVTDVNEAPSLNGGATFNAAENQTFVTNFATTDPESSEGAGLTYSIAGGTDASLFAIDANTGALSFRAAADFETPGDSNGDNAHIVNVRVTDAGGLSATKAITVNVTDVNETPVFSGPTSFNAAENQTAVANLLATDAESAGGAGLTFSIAGGTDAALFQIDATTGALSFRAAPDFETPGDSNTDNVHAVTVQVTDAGGETATRALTVTVTDLNGAPAFTSAASVNAPENQTAVTNLIAVDSEDAEGAGLTYSIAGGTDAALFQVNAATGALSFRSAPDFEAPVDSNGDNVHTLTVRVTDNGGLSDDLALAVTVTDIDETPPVPTSPPGPTTPTGPTDGADRLVGTAEADLIRALGGDDTVIGLGGDDSLFGSTGNDQIRGSRGDDRIRGNGGEDNLKGNGGADNINGGGGADNIRGGGGGDFIKGGGGADTVKAGGGADVINGGGGADLLQGGGGADTITGRGGDDTLQGNGGADVFQFRASDRNDTIRDFRQGQDKIEIINGARSFEALVIEQDGNDVLIGFGPGQVRVVTDLVGAFDESDFIF